MSPQHGPSPYTRRRRIAEWPLATVKNISAVIAAMVLFLAILGYVYSFGQATDSISNKLDRNCRFLAIVEADTRYLIVQHTQSHATADAFRDIFKNSLRDTCG